MVNKTFVLPFGATDNNVRAVINIGFEGKMRIQCQAMAYDLNPKIVLWSNIVNGIVAQSTYTIFEYDIDYRDNNQWQFMFIDTTTNLAIQPSVEIILVIKFTSL